MNVLLLIYELNRELDPNFDYSAFFKIRDSYSPMKISEYTYALRTAAETPSQVRHKLQKSLHADDNLYVITLKKPYSSRGLKKIVSWMDEAFREHI